MGFSFSVRLQCEGAYFAVPIMDPKGYTYIHKETKT